ncbi:Transposase [Kibdelosporangium sp. 4NS15]|uniref:Transposase n=1 Tax=Kibdelosporangium persicum TaxID=2698649 RepID=A0ABX2EVM7_9PSEU|nr:Transposase [Kibdelosporangium persicum]
MTGHHLTVPAPKKYPDDLRRRAVRLVFDTRRARGNSYGVIAEVATRLGIGDQSLRTWVRHAEIHGESPGEAISAERRITELSREVQRLRRSNEILKAASAFFARELDPRPSS